MALCFEFDPVFNFVSERVGGINQSAGTRVIGWEKGGEVVAGAVFDDFNGRNVWMHIAADRPLTRAFVRACAQYAFVVCGAARVSGWVEASNLKARRMDEKAGFTIEATLEGAARDGGDVLIYVLWKEDCKYV